MCVCGVTNQSHSFIYIIALTSLLLKAYRYSIFNLVSILPSDRVHKCSSSVATNRHIPDGNSVHISANCVIPHRPRREIDKLDI